MRSTDPRAFCRVMMRDQHALVAARQATAAGVSRAALRNLLQRGDLEWFLPGVFRLKGAPETYEQDVMGMVLWSGDGAAAAGRCAARLRKLGGVRTNAVEIATITRKDARKALLPSGRRTIVHRVDNHLLPEISAGLVPTTSIRRTVLDLCGRRDPLAESCLDHALRDELESIGSFWLYLEQEWMRGRRGVAILRDLLAPRTGGQAPTDSEMELEGRRRVREAGLPQPVGQHPIVLPFSEIHVDLAYPEIKLAIELDSYSWHLNRKAMERDRERDNALQLLGWVVLRFTWAMLRYDKSYVRKTVRDMFETLSASRGSL